MKPRTTRETAMICVAAVLVVAVLVIPFEIHSYGQRPDTNGVIFLVAAAVIALGMILGYRYLIARKRAQLELAGGEQYRRLAEEYRRLADSAITAQEHTDLKLGDFSAQLDYLHEQNDSMRKILKDGP
jgi:hypothetical protein